MPPWAEAMGAGSSLASYANPVAAVAGSVIGDVVSGYFGERAADEAWKRQKKVLQKQLQWRVADAQAAGLHPLAALGLNPASGPAAAVTPDFGDMGAGDAVRSMMLGSQEAGRVNPLELIRQNLELDLLKAQIGEIRSRSVANTAGGAGMIGNTIVSDMKFSDKTQSAWSDAVSGIMGVIKFFEDNWNTDWKRWPLSKGPFGTGWGVSSQSDIRRITDPPAGYVGRR